MKRTPTEQKLDDLADIEEHALDAMAPGLRPPEQILEARRRLLWAARWLLIARVSADCDTKDAIATTARHIRTAADELTKDYA